MPIVLKNLPDGTIDLDELRYAIVPNNTHLPQPKVICLENSHNHCNGNTISLEYINKVRQLCDEKNLKLHLDGARSLNAAVALGVTPAELGKDFDTISLCFSKGLSCPFGTAIIGSSEDI